MAEAKRISPDEVLRKMERGENILLLDVRAGSWRESEVKARGAYRIAPSEIWLRYTELPRDREIIAY